ncbi:type II toxin-antitoxin system RelE/ParE family toxin [Geminocystis sp.]|uniref:type II toxin-antitoxin system RelE/ParE family toxin n=1 Tax=Geminocystis sp. TaxID=2664100 RepID=UPI00359493B2
MAIGSYNFSEEAIKDLKEICDYVAKINPQSASNLFDSIRNKCKLVANFLNLGKNYHKLKPSLKGFFVDDYIIFIILKLMEL